VTRDKGLSTRRGGFICREPIGFNHDIVVCGILGASVQHISLFNVALKKRRGGQDIQCVHEFL
jgi:hypothetical protein